MQSKKQANDKAFGSFMAILGCYSYHTVIVKIPRLLCMMNQYVGMHQYQKILRWTQFVGCSAKKQANNKKKAFWSFMVILGVLKLPYINS